MAGAEVSQASCGHCGAPLPLSHGPIVVCQYCRRELRIGSPRPMPAAPPARAPGSNAALVWAILGALVLLGLGIGVSLIAMLSRTPSSRNDAPRAPESGGAVPGDQSNASTSPLMFWLDYPPIVVLGADTTAPIVVGMAYWQSDSQLTALDGASGKVLWHTPSPSLRAYGNGEVLLTFDDGKKLTRFDPRTGVKRWNLTFAEDVYDITFGPSCASLLHSSGKKLGIDVQSGQVVACAPAVQNQFPSLRDKITDTTASVGDFTFVGSVELDDKPINPDPPRLAAQVSRAGRTAWKVAPAGLEPVWTSDGFGRSLVLTPTGVFVLGRSSSDHSTTWLLLDMNSGRELYRRTSPLKVETSVRLVGAGPLVFAEHDQRVEAYRVATGELAWSVGLKK